MPATIMKENLDSINKEIIENIKDPFLKNLILDDSKEMFKNINSISKDELNKRIERAKNNTDYIYEPLKSFEEKYEYILEEEITKYFDNLVKKSNTNKEKATSDYNDFVKLKETENNLNSQLNKLNGKNSLRKGLSILSIVLGIISLFICIGSYSNENKAYFIVSLILAIILIPLGIFFLVKKNKQRESKILELKDKLSKNKVTINEKIKECIVDMEGLNNSFRYHMFNEIFSNVIKGIYFNDYLSYKKFLFLNKKYQLSFDQGKEESMKVSLSGELFGSPFVFYTSISHELKLKTYSGSLTISYYVGSGKDRRLVHETLHASISKPCPRYEDNATLFFGNEAAPNLHFIRRPSFIKSPLSKKDLDKEIKKINKKEEEAILNGKKFTLMSNKEFEVYFNALTRDNENEFRLLFTPLAQNSLISLISENTYFGDDWLFIKDGMRNFIKSCHSQSFEFEIDPSTFKTFSFPITEKLFRSYCRRFFLNLYFDIAPILSIPLYQQHKPLEYIYEDYYERNFSSYDIEPLLNHIDESYFRPIDTDTSLILKGELLNKIDNFDLINVNAKAYEKIPRVEYVSVFSVGAGRSYNVPINYFEYILKEEDTRLLIIDLDSKKIELSNFLNKISKYIIPNSYKCYSSLSSFVLKKDITNIELNALISILKEKTI